MRRYLLLFLVLSIIVGVLISREKTNFHKVSRDIYYQIENDSIRFRDKYSGDWLSIITKKDFPWLFKNLKYGLRLIPLYPNNKQHYLIGNIYPDHGGYAYSHFVIIDINNNNKILYESKKLFNKGIFSNVWVLPNDELRLVIGYPKRAYYGLSPSYLLTEFIIYDQKTDSYISNNTAHKDKIKEVLNQIKKTNKCAVENGGKKITFEEIKKRFGENYKCRSNDEYFNSPNPGFANKPYNGIPILNPITPKEYFAITSFYTEILNNKEASLFVKVRL
jgi:hypothetical protein